MFDPLDDLEVAIDKIAACEVASEAAVDVARLTTLVERLEFQRLRAVRAVDRSGAWQADGALTMAAWLRHRCRMTHGAAAASVRLARRLELLRETSDAFAAGAISRQHAAVLADVCTPEREAAIVELEPQLIAAARASDVREFRSLVSYVCDALDGDGGAASANAQHERRRLHVSQLLDGMVVVDGLLDREAGEIVVTALRAAMDAPCATETRSTAQRRADALVTLCEAAARGLASGPARAHRPHVTVNVDLEVLERRGGPTLVGRVRADGAQLGRLSAETLRRIACDASVARVVTDGASAPLDVGRTTRVVSPALWRALVVRDGGCVAPGCDRPPGWCDAHHRVHWVDGGRTSLDNLELRCRRHHRAVHEGAGRGGPEP